MVITKVIRLVVTASKIVGQVHKGSFLSNGNSPFFLTYMNTPNWKMSRGYFPAYLKISKRKVCNVTEYKNKPNTVGWKGDLDDGTYFSVAVVDGILSICFDEREMNLTKDIKLVAYCSLLDDIVNPVDGTLINYIGFTAALQDLHDFTNNLTFAEVMDYFKWQYATDKVEIYDYNFK